MLNHEGKRSRLTSFTRYLKLSNTYFDKPLIKFFTFKTEQSDTNHWCRSVQQVNPLGNDSHYNAMSEFDVCGHAIPIQHIPT